MGSPERPRNRESNQGKRPKEKWVRVKLGSGFIRTPLKDMADDHHPEGPVDAQELLKYVQETSKMAVLTRKRVRGH